MLKHGSLIGSWNKDHGFVCKPFAMCSLIDAFSFFFFFSLFRVTFNLILFLCFAIILAGKLILHHHHFKISPTQILHNWDLRRQYQIPTSHLKTFCWSICLFIHLHLPGLHLIFFFLFLICFDENIFYTSQIYNTDTCQIFFKL